MEKFIVSARKYRPSEFDEVVGQSAVTKTLERALSSKQIGHSFLFCGPRGVGKTTCARILANVINKQSEEDDRNYSINIFELDAASNNSVEDIKTLIDQVRIPPQIGDYKVYIIDEVHMLSSQAFNAFLKTLEEPPSYAIFILATTEKHKILPTILSRCQIYDFKRISVKDISDHLANICKKEGIEFEESALNIIAQKADGALRDALSMFDRLVDRSTKSISFDSVITDLNILDHEYYFKLTDLLMAQDLPESLLLFNEILSQGFDGEEFISGLSEHFRNLLVSKEAKTRDLLESGAELNLRYQQQSQLIPTAFLLNALDISNEANFQYKSAKNKRLHIELVLMKMAHLPSILNTELKKKPLKSDINTEVVEPAIDNSDTPLSTEITKTVLKEESEKIDSKGNSKENVKENDIPLEEKNNKPVEKSVSGKAKSKGLDFNVNLKKLKNREFEESKETQDDSSEDNIELDSELTDEQIKDSWNQVRADYKENDTVFFPVLDHSEARLSENEINLVFDTQGSKELYLTRSEEILGKFFDYLGIKVPTKPIVEKSVEENAPKKVFTAKDKWQFLEEKNPDLKLLKEKLQLYIKD